MMLKKLLLTFSGFIRLLNKGITSFIVRLSKIPDKNIALITPDLIANTPPKSVKITVVLHPNPLEYIAMSVFEKPISL